MRKFDVIALENLIRAVKEISPRANVPVYFDKYTGADVLLLELLKQPVMITSPQVSKSELPNGVSSHGEDNFLCDFLESFIVISDK